MKLSAWVSQPYRIFQQLNFSGAEGFHVDCSRGQGCLGGLAFPVVLTKNYSSKWKLDNHRFSAKVHQLNFENLPRAYPTLGTAPL